MNKKLAFIMPVTAKSASSRYRFVQYLKFFSNDGFDYDLFWPRTKKLKGKKLSNKFNYLINTIKLIYYLLTRNYSCIFIQKHILHPKLPIEYFLPKYLKKKTILDIDDSVFLLSPRRYALILKSVSKVIAGSVYLKKYCEVYSKNVFIVPTSVDLDKIKGIPLTSKRSLSQKRLTFGWIGSPSGLKYIETLYNALVELNKIVQIELIVVSDFTLFDKIAIEGIKVTNYQWKEDEEYAHFKEFDIGLMPLDKNEPFTEGKCSFKVIQYMANKVPVLCANVGNNSEVIRSGVNGYLYANGQEFISQVLKILNNPAEVEMVIETAYNEVLQKYSLENNYTKLRLLVDS